jgi:hypothetical protein
MKKKKQGREALPQTPSPLSTTELTENTEMRTEARGRAPRAPQIKKWGAGASPASVPISAFSVSSVVDNWGYGGLPPFAVFRRMA